jgi:hypothetical protein
MCTVATAVKAVCKCCGGVAVLGEIRILIASPCNYKSKFIGMLALMGEKRKAYRILVGRSEGTRPLGRPRRRWEDSIKTEVSEMERGGMDWIDLA